MQSIIKAAGIDPDHSLVLQLAQTSSLAACPCLLIPHQQFLSISDFGDYPLYLVAAGRLTSDTNTFEIGTHIDEDIYEHLLHAEEPSKVYKLDTQMANKYLSEVSKCTEEFTCILESIYKIELQVPDRNCIQLITLKEGKRLTDEYKMNKYFYVLLEGACNIKRGFKINDKKDYISLDVYSFKNYYLLGEEALFSEEYLATVTCLSDCYFMKINVEKFSRQLPFTLYMQLRVQYKSKYEECISTSLNESHETKLHLVNPRDIVDYFERAKQMNKGRLLRDKDNEYSRTILQKFCEKNQMVHSNYMNYFIESTEDKIRFQLISKGFKKPELNEKTSHTLSKQQMRKVIRRKVLNELKTRGRPRNNIQELRSRSGFKVRRIL